MNREELQASGLSAEDMNWITSIADLSTVRCVYPTGSLIDTGSWFRKQKVWVMCTDRELVLLATGVQPYRERVALADLQESIYNHVTASVTLALAPTRVQTLLMNPTQGYNLLVNMGIQPERDTNPRS
jgi:hypothetical protein